MLNQIDRRGVASSSMMRVAGVGLLATFAYVLGTQGALEPSAQAATSASGGTVIVNDITTPVLALSANERAIIGSADGLFYLVDYDGNSIEVKGVRRSALEWHRGPVPPASR
jgi:hypothetical protein